MYDEVYVRRALADECEKAGSQVAWAAANNLKSSSYVSDVIHGRRAPGSKILKALKIRRVVSYTDAPA